MFEREISKRIKTDDGYEDVKLKRLLNEAKEAVLMEFEAKKRGSVHLNNRSRQQLEEKMEGVMRVKVVENASRRRQHEEEYMNQLVIDCKSVGERERANE